MTPPEFAAATEVVRKLIYEQAASRLESQVAFATTHDSRATTLVSWSASLGAASAGFSIKAISDHALPLAWAAGLAAAGFTLAACLSLLSVRSRGFHAKGWYPHDFLEDLKSSKPANEIEADIIEDTETRLRHNARILEVRGRFFNAAVVTVGATPLVAFILGLVLAK